MNDLEGVLRDSTDDQEMQRMAEDEQQQLQQQVCTQALSAEQVLDQSGAKVVAMTCQLHACDLSGVRHSHPVALRRSSLLAKGPSADLSCSCYTTSYIRHVFDNFKCTCLVGALLPN